MFVLCNTFYICFLIFIFFPVVGARSFWLSEITSGQLFIPIMNTIYDHFEINGGAVPSSHVAVATVVLYYAHKYVPRTTAIYGPICVSLMISTVYCRYHYAIDVIAGIVVAVATIALSRQIEQPGRYTYNREEFATGRYQV
jgi:membrane-associated phospholipid phosphatase